MTRQIIAILPAAGIGSRMRVDKPKQYLKILDKTILEHTLTVMLTHSAVTQIILAVNRGDPYIANIALIGHPKIQTIIGGETRAESVFNGLKVIDEKNTWVLVHDAARPCLTHSDIDKLLAVNDDQGAILAIPVTDTIKRATADQQILQTEDRTQLWQAQTPQFFRADLLKHALMQAFTQKVNVTDEASAMELAGFRPHLIVGRSDNLKVTRPEDLALAEFYLSKRKEEK